MSALDASPPRVLIVGTGAPGGIGRVEQLLAEAALSTEVASLQSTVAMWKRRHPDYLRAGAISQLPTLGGPFDNGRRYAWALLRAIRSVRPDYILYTHVNLARLAPLMAPVGHPPYGVWVYGVDIFTRLSYAHRLALKQAQVVLTISQHSAERTISQQGVASANVHIVPLTLPEAMFMDRTSSTEERVPERVLTVARLATSEDGKNLDQVIYAIKQVHDACPRAELIMVGDGDDRARLEGIAHQIGAEQFVQFLGHLTDEELEAEYDRADVFALPSEKEGFGLVFVEAMLAGTPSVGIAIGGPLDIIRDRQDGRLIRRPDELGDCLVELFQDRAQLEIMRDSARQHARESFSPAAFRTALANALNIDDAPPASS